jgi:transcriptional regulator with XRE-family HTH domain
MTRSELQAWRVERGMSTLELAQALGISQRMVQAMEKGERVVSERTARQIRALRVRRKPVNITCVHA